MHIEDFFATYLENANPESQAIFYLGIEIIKQIPLMTPPEDKNTKMASLARGICLVAMTYADENQKYLWESLHIEEKTVLTTAGLRREFLPDNNPELIRLIHLVAEKIDALNVPIDRNYNDMIEIFKQIAHYEYLAAHHAINKNLHTAMQQGHQELKAKITELKEQNQRVIADADRLFDTFQPLAEMIEQLSRQSQTVSTMSKTEPSTDQPVDASVSSTPQVDELPKSTGIIRNNQVGTTRPAVSNQTRNRQLSAPVRARPRVQFQEPDTVSQPSDDSEFINLFDLAISMNKKLATDLPDLKQFTLRKYREGHRLYDKTGALAIARAAHQFAEEENTEQFRKAMQKYTRHSKGLSAIMTALIAAVVGVAVGTVLAGVSGAVVGAVVLGAAGFFAAKGCAKCVSPVSDSLEFTQVPGLVMAS